MRGKKSSGGFPDQTRKGLKASLDKLTQRQGEVYVTYEERACRLDKNVLAHCSGRKLGRKGKGIDITRKEESTRREEIS